MRKNLLSKVFGVVAALTMATSATAGTASAWYTKIGGVIDYPSLIDNGGYFGRYYRNVDVAGECHCYGIQGMLQVCGYNLTVDGILGKKSDAAIKSFQSSKRITVDGIVGKDTYKRLVNSSGILYYDKYGYIK
ncbi:MAG: peptidoglycan-binding protein [Oscillospiraceae bacterium]|nr:peptidoglycan-binding protein [Oscillospiraceae bacterium]